MGGFDYIPKTGRIYVVSLTTSWAQVLTTSQTKACRGIKVKSRYTHNSGAPGPFDLAFVSSPSSGADSDGNGFLSSPGGTLADTISPSNGLWAKSAVSGTLLEIIVYE